MASKSWKSQNKQMWIRLSAIVCSSDYITYLTKSSKWSWENEKLNKETIIVGFFILQYAKLIMLQMYYNFSNVFCDYSKFELIEMDTDSLYMTISERNIEEIITDAWNEETVTKLSIRI